MQSKNLRNRRLRSSDLMRDVVCAARSADHAPTARARTRQRRQAGRASDVAQGLRHRRRGRPERRVLERQGTVGRGRSCDRMEKSRCRF